MRQKLIILALILLTSCVKDGINTEKNGEFKIDLLFEKDGCKMYRFKDGSDYIYWSNCNGNTQYSAYRSNGKSGYSELIQTITSK